MLKEKVEKLAEKVFEENKSLFLISLDVNDNNNIKLVLDGDEGVSVNDCIMVSRAIEHNLDRDEEDFSLEVTSAGVSEPLSMARQYKKNIGRKLKVTTAQEKYEGTLDEANDEQITLSWKAREPKPVGKGKITVQKEVVLPYSDILEAKVKITF
ncbi:MAG: ribosome assembly cofactor RimP [Christiangramia sp.]|uniref:ribosome assembly cofactor RimP n=1 Tax=Christiangramia sp. TaxID=1931228 RepID=UPI0032425CC9